VSLAGAAPYGSKCGGEPCATPLLVEVLLLPLMPGTALAQLDKRGAIVLCERLSRAQVEVRLATMAPYLVGMEVCNEASGSS
jgi:hypothetical protein